MEGKRDIKIATNNDCSYLAYFELSEDVLAAVEREIVIHAYSVKKKQALADSFITDFLPGNLLKLIS